MRLYKAEYVATDHADDWDEETSDTFPEPDGWAEHCMALWGEHRDFFPPTDRHLYRSRSAAQRRVDLINRWLGDGAAIDLDAHRAADHLRLAGELGAALHEDRHVRAQRQAQRRQALDRPFEPP